jgi:hypothetical protein
MSAHYLVRLWFVANVLLALIPPLHWEIARYERLVLGLPATLFYFLLLSLSITGSIIYAYWKDSTSGEFQP